MARVHHQTVGEHDLITIVSDGPWKQNCHLVLDRPTGSFIVVDPGVDTPELRDAIRSAGSRPAHMIVTHGHPDHLGAADALTSELDVDCLISRADRRVVHQAPTYAAAFGRTRIRLPDRLRFIDDDEDLHLGTARVTISAVPGHTPGSLAFFLGALVLTGDTLLRQHVGRTDLPLSDPGALAGSIGRLLADSPGQALLAAGHGHPWTVSEARAWWHDRDPQQPGAAGQ